MYHWFKEARRQARGGDMGGFTRILHSGKPDEFVREIPTFVADPLPEGTTQVMRSVAWLPETAILPGCLLFSLLLPWFPGFLLLVVVTGSEETRNVGKN
jgi:hypothetical protein